MLRLSSRTTRQLRVVDGAQNGIELLEFEGERGDDSLKPLVVGLQEADALDVSGEPIVELLKSQLFLLPGNNNGSRADREFL